jgi:hypothetical protein
MAPHRGLVAVVVAAAVMLFSALPLLANPISVAPQAMEGNIKVSPGTVVNAGYDLAILGSHSADVLQADGLRSRNCRRYATAVIVNGIPGTCSWDGKVYRCNAGGFLREWSYRNLGDFILESNTPNRLLAASRQTSGGSLLVSSGSWTTIYTYDALGRLIGRARRGFNSFNSWLIDTTTYAEWDRFNRPIAGQVSLTDGNTMPLSLSYADADADDAERGSGGQKDREEDEADDDAVSVVQASNGELVARDKKGNIVKEVEFSNGTATNYVVTRTAKVCE